MLLSGQVGSCVLDGPLDVRRSGGGQQSKKQGSELTGLGELACLSFRGTVWLRMGRRTRFCLLPVGGVGDKVFSLTRPLVTSELGGGGAFRGCGHLLPTL